MFGRATITLGIGPHSSCSAFSPRHVDRCKFCQLSSTAAGLSRVPVSAFVRNTLGTCDALRGSSTSAELLLRHFAATSCDLSDI